jgi:hypothetical protein
MSEIERPIIPTGVVGYTVKATTDVVSAISGKQLILREMAVNNRAATSNICGVKISVPDGMWKAGFMDLSATPDYIDRTTLAQSGTTDAFTLFGTGADDDGFVVQCKEKFNLITLQVTTAEVGSPVYAATYWNGTSWAALTTIEIPAAFTAAEHCIAFAIPTNWAVNSGAAISQVTTGNGLDADYYTIKILATTSPATAPLASRIYVGKVLDFVEALADNNMFDVYPPGLGGLELHGGEGISPYFKTAHADNTVSIKYSIRN